MIRESAGDAVILPKSKQNTSRDSHPLEGDVMAGTGVSLQDISSRGSDPLSRRVTRRRDAGVGTRAAPAAGSRQQTDQQTGHHHLNA